MENAVRWRATVTWWMQQQQLDDDEAVTLTERLPGFGACTRRGENLLAAEMTVEARTAAAAAEVAGRAARDAMAATGCQGSDLVGIEVLTTGEFDRRLQAPSEMGLIGMAEAAEILGISRQRVSQLWQENPKFPKPVAVPRCGAVFTTASILLAKQRGWDLPGGRPVKSKKS